MAGTAVLVGLWSLAGGIAGWALVPAAADVLLRRSHNRSCSWWWDCCDAYRRFVQAHPGREPSCTARGEEGALGLWRDDALRTVRQGALPRERAQALADLGLAVDIGACRLDEAQQRDRFTFLARLWQRSACAGACAAAGASLGCLALGGSCAMTQAAVLACCALAMAAAIVCDLKARTIPLETCAAIAVAGSVFQILACGVKGLVAGALFAGIVVVGCVVANLLVGRRSGRAAVGYGDVRCMAALSLVCGAASPFGFAACYACAGAFSAVGMALGRLEGGDGIPMAPFLALWLMGGAVACVAV